MSDELIKNKIDEYLPECHDAGKLIYTEKNGKDAHWDFLEKAEFPHQKSILQHHYKEYLDRKDDIFIYFPEDEYIFLVSIADSYAAGMIREKEIKGDPNYIVNKLWNKNKWDFENFRRPFYAHENIIRRCYKLSYWEFEKNLRSFLSQPNPKDFLIRYNLILKTRAEDAHPSRNISSLYNHSILTKKLFGIIIESILQEENKLLLEKIKNITSKKYYIQNYNLEEFRNEVEKLINEIGNKLKVYIAFYEIKINHKIFRAHDLNLLSKIFNSISKLEDEYYYNFIFNLCDKFLIMASRQKYQIIHDYLKEKIVNEFKIFIIEKLRENAQLNQINDAVERIIREQTKIEVLTPRCLEENNFVLPPICEICNLNQGKEYIEEENFKKEFLCDNCKKIREEGKSKNVFSNYSQWEEGEIVALYIDLNLESFLEWINSLYTNYLKSQNIMNKIEIKNPYVYWRDFIEDVSYFKKELHDTLKNELGKSEVEDVYDNILLIHIKKPLNFILLIEKIYQLLKENISSIFDLETYWDNKANIPPLRMVLSISDVKYPFFLHYKNFQDEEYKKNDIVIFYKNEVIPMSYIQFEKFINLIITLRDKKNHIVQSKFYQLLEITKTSEELGKIFYKEKEIQIHTPPILIESLGFNRLMSLYRLTMEHLIDEEGMD